MEHKFETEALEAYTELRPLCNEFTIYPEYYKKWIGRYVRRGYFMVGIPILDYIDPDREYAYIYKNTEEFYKKKVVYALDKTACLNFMYYFGAPFLLVVGIVLVYAWIMMHLIWDFICKPCCCCCFFRSE